MLMYGLAYPVGIPGLSEIPDRERDGILGLVRALEHESAPVSNGQFREEMFRLVRDCLYNMEGNKVEEVNYNWGGDSALTSYYSYDDSGKKIELTIKQGAIRGKTVYSYFDKEHRVEALEKIGDGTFSRTGKHSAVYDAFGKLIETSYLDENISSKAFYRYLHDHEGRVVQIDTLDAGGVQYHRIIYSYDTAGNLINESAYNPEGVLYKKAVFTYDHRSKSGETFSYRADGSLYLRLIETYDERDNIVAVSVLSEDGEPRYITRNDYEYDSAGNWVKRTIRNTDPEGVRAVTSAIERRVFSYY